jgi:hypothetical protein
MREVVVIEKDELDGLSVLIAERIIAYSNMSYGFKMVSQETGRALGEDVMLGMLAVPIRKALQGREK